MAEIEKEDELLFDSFGVFTARFKEVPREDLKSLYKLEPFFSFVSKHELLEQRYIEFLKTIFNCAAGINSKPAYYFKDIDYNELINVKFIQEFPILTVPNPDDKKSLELNKETIDTKVIFNGSVLWNQKIHKDVFPFLSMTKLQKYVLKVLEKEKDVPDFAGFLKIDDIEGDFEENFKNKNFDAIIKYALLSGLTALYRKKDDYSMLKKGLPLSLFLEIVNSKYPSGKKNTEEIHAAIAAAAGIPGTLNLMGKESDYPQSTLDIFNLYKKKELMDNILDESPLVETRRRNAL